MAAIPHYSQSNVYDNVIQAMQVGSAVTGESPQEAENAPLLNKRQVREYRFHYLAANRRQIQAGLNGEGLDYDRLDPCALLLCRTVSYDDYWDHPGNESIHLIRKIYKKQLESKGAELINTRRLDFEHTPVLFGSKSYISFPEVYIEREERSQWIFKRFDNIPEDLVYFDHNGNVLAQLMNCESAFDGKIFIDLWRADTLTMIEEGFWNVYKYHLKKIQDQYSNSPEC